MITRYFRINNHEKRMVLLNLKVKEMEKNAKFTQEDKGDFLQVTILLPKTDRCFT